MHSVAASVTRLRQRFGCSEAGQQKKADQQKTLALYEVGRMTMTQLEVYLDVCKDKYLRALVEPGMIMKPMTMRPVILPCPTCKNSPPATN